MIKSVSPLNPEFSRNADIKKENTKVPNEKLSLHLNANDGLIDELQLIEDIIKENICTHEMGQKTWTDFKHG